MTISEKTTCTAIVCPEAYELFAVDDVTLITVGSVVSITSALLNRRDPAAPGVASVSVALFAAASTIVPPLRVRAVVER